MNEVNFLIAIMLRILRELLDDNEIMKISNNFLENQSRNFGLYWIESDL